MNDDDLVPVGVLSRCLAGMTFVSHEADVYAGQVDKCHSETIKT